MSYKQVVQKALEDFSKGNIAGIIEVCDDNIDWKNPDAPDVPFAISVKGKDKVGSFFATMADMIDVTRFEMNNFVEENNTVISWGSYDATVKATGKSFTTPLVLIWEFGGNGKCAKWTALTNTSPQAKAFSKN